MDVDVMHCPDSPYYLLVCTDLGSILPILSLENILFGHKIHQACCDRRNRPRIKWEIRLLLYLIFVQFIWRELLF